MLDVRRQDVGVDIVYLPERRLVILHPDLDYAESLGAIRGAIPCLHPDVAVRLVEKVTPRPRPKRARPGTWLAGLAAVAAGIGWAQPAAATMFGPTWEQEMERMGLTCSVSEGSIRTCISSDGEVAEVTGYRRDGASLYVLRRPGHDERFFLIFDTREQAQRWHETHPDKPVTGRVAAL